jgi:hypothetical protein
MENKINEINYYTYQSLVRIFDGLREHGGGFFYFDDLCRVAHDAEPFGEH